MILILGGTTEGRIAVRVLDQSDKTFYYSTRGKSQDVHTLNGKRVTGGMNTEEMVKFCTQKGINLLIDAAHPFAVNLHQTVDEVSQELSLPVIRLERKYPPRDSRVVWCNSYQDAIDKMESHQVNRLLALSGVQTIEKLRAFWTTHDSYFRIIDRDESRALAEKQGFPAERIYYYNAGADEESLLNELHPDAILTKESGETGGFQQKLDAAFKKNIKVFAVKRPQLPSEFINVYGEHGLRKAVEKYLPSFYPLKTGFTTGSCATAAAKAALLSIIHQEQISVVPFILPDTEELSMLVKHSEWNASEASATVIKNAGDDPDVTNGLEIVATVKLLSSKQDSLDAERIRIKGGVGVGKVTLSGLGLPIGEAAINLIPRQMIKDNLERVLDENHLYDSCCEVTISVPKGAEIAKRTFNPRLGIVGGISIIGTSGIVKPFSSDAFIGSIKKEMQVGVATGTDTIVINSGAKSEKVVRALYPSLPYQSFVHYGNFIGETIKIANELKVVNLVLGIMIGKAVKLADGHLDTHSKKVVMNKEFIKQLLTDLNCSAEEVSKIEQMTLARELWEIVPESKLQSFISLLKLKCYEVCKPLLPKGKLLVILIQENGTCYVD